MQRHGIGAGAAHSRNLLPRLHVLPVIHQHCVVMGIGGDVVLTVLNHDQIAITPQLIADIDNFARIGSIHRCASGAGDINAFVSPFCGGVRDHHFAAGRPDPAALPDRRPGRFRYGVRWGDRSGFTAAL